MRSIRFLYISHGHYDHTLGIPQVLTQKSPLDIYAHPGVFQNRFWIKENTPPKFIGIPYKKEYLESLGAKFNFIKEFTEIQKGLFASGEIPRKTAFEKTDQNMKVLTPENTFVQDEIPDDFSLAIDTPKGLVVLLGCAHAGMVNILNHFIEKTGKDTIYAVIGGTHLGFATSEQFEKTLDVLDQFKIAKLGVSHCTGLAISARLCTILQERFFFASVGAVLEI